MTGQDDGSHRVADLQQRSKFPIGQGDLLFGIHLPALVDLAGRGERWGRLLPGLMRLERFRAGDPEQGRQPTGAGQLLGAPALAELQLQQDVGRSPMGVGLLELDRLLAENEFNRAGLFAANRPRAFADFLEPRERPPLDAGLSAIIVEGAPGDRLKARAGLTSLQVEGRVAFGGFFDDGAALVVVRSNSRDEALAWLACAGWDPARLVARDWSQTL